MRVFDPEYILIISLTKIKQLKIKLINDFNLAIRIEEAKPKNKYMFF